MNTATANPEADQKPETTHEPTFPGRPQPLSRPFQGRMLAGVAAGIARYLGVEVTIVRIALVVLTFVGGVAVPVYLAGWLLIPEEGREQSIATELIQSVQARSR
jgi:phage shock protein C